jgi:hypothetical protein
MVAGMVVGTAVVDCGPRGIVVLRNGLDETASKDPATLHFIGASNERVLSKCEPAAESDVSGSALAGTEMKTLWPKAL